MDSSTPQSVSNKQPHDQLLQLISSWVTPLGYRIIHLEVESHRQKVLRVFIDHLPVTGQESSARLGIGSEDCAKVSRAIDELLDQSTEVQTMFPGTYELEVSSPGADRPLRTADDFQQFAGEKVRIHLYRPLTGEEIENPPYQEKNPKQKNFLGTLAGLQGSKVLLSLRSTETGSKSRQKGGKKSSQSLGKQSKAEKTAELTTNSVEGTQVAIPLPLISKANLEPDFDFEGAMKESHEL